MMKKITKSVFLFLMGCGLFISCEEGDPLEPKDTEDNKNPDEEINATEITGEKWSFAGRDDYETLELTESGIYILVKSESATGGRMASETGKIISGKYEISEDKKTIVLIGFGSITITSVSEGSIIFKLKLDRSTAEIELRGNQEETIAASEKTNLLCKTWIPTGETACDDCESGTWDEQLEETGRKFEITFTEGKTILITTQSVNCSVGPDGSKECILGSIEHQKYGWDWKDSTQSSITISNGSESIDREITTLTETLVGFSPLFLGDVIQMKAK